MNSPEELLPTSPIAANEEPWSPDQNQSSRRSAVNPPALSDADKLCKVHNSFD